jgi:hypothetical protein
MTTPPSKLTGEQYKQFQNALLSAFPNHYELREMLLFQLEKHLDPIAGGTSLQEVVFNLIRVAVAQGWIADLVEKAHEHNSGNAELREFAERWLSSNPLDPQYPPDDTPASLPEEPNDTNPSTESELARLLEDFLRKYSRWYFNATRIRNWGSKQTGFSRLGEFNANNIRQELKKWRHLES